MFAAYNTRISQSTFYVVCGTILHFCRVAVRSRMYRQERVDNDLFPSHPTTPLAYIYTPLCVSLLFLRRRRRNAPSYPATAPQMAPPHSIHHSSLQQILAPLFLLVARGWVGDVSRQNNPPPSSFGQSTKRSGTAAKDGLPPPTYRRLVISKVGPPPNFHGEKKRCAPLLSGTQPYTPHHRVFFSQKSHSAKAAAARPHYRQLPPSREQKKMFLFWARESRFLSSF